MLPALAIAGIGMQAGSSLLEGYFGKQQKENEAAIYKYNAEVARQQAKWIMKRTKFMQGRQAEQAARIQGELEASIGGSGTVSTQGAPMLALALQKSESDIESFLIGLEGRKEAEQALSQAEQYDMARQMAKIGAKQSMLGGFLGAGAAAFTGLSMLPKTQTPAPMPDVTKTQYAYQSYRPFSGYGVKA